MITRDGLDVAFAAFDLSPRTVRLIRDGIVDFAIDQQPYMQANLVIQLLVITARYQMTPLDIDTSVSVVDATNVADVEGLTRASIR